MVYGDSSTSVFALSAATGKTIWEDSSLLNSGQGAFEIQPQVAAGGSTWPAPTARDLAAGCSWR